MAIFFHTNICYYGLVMFLFNINHAPPWKSFCIVFFWGTEPVMLCSSAGLYTVLSCGIIDAGYLCIVQTLRWVFPMICILAYCNWTLVAAWAVGACNGSAAWMVRERLCRWRIPQTDSCCILKYDVIWCILKALIGRQNHHGILFLYIVSFA